MRERVEENASSSPIATATSKSSSYDAQFLLYASRIALRTAVRSSMARFDRHSCEAGGFRMALPLSSKWGSSPRVVERECAVGEEMLAPVDA